MRRTAFTDLSTLDFSQVDRLLSRGRGDRARLSWLVLVVLCINVVLCVACNQPPKKNQSEKPVVETAASSKVVPPAPAETTSAADTTANPAADDDETRDDAADTDDVDDTQAATLEAGAHPLSFANTKLDQDAILERLADAQMLRFRPVGTSSIVFRADLEADFDAAFKSSSEKRPRAHAAEVTAYRMARMLGLDNVPPVITRTLPSDVMRSRMTPKSAWTEMRSWIGDVNGVVTGATIYWISGIQESGLDTRAGTARYSEWLRHQGRVDNDDRMLARDVSNMIAFDCVIGNWDRWSGGNMKGDAAGKRLYIRDHDVAFPGRLSVDLQRRLFDRLTPVERFSTQLIKRLRALTRESLARELAHDPAGANLLDARQLSGVLDRRDAVLSHVDALIASHGSRAVLFFP